MTKWKRSWEHESMQSFYNEEAEQVVTFTAAGCISIDGCGAIELIDFMEMLERVVDKGWPAAIYTGKFWTEKRHSHDD